MSDPPSNGPSVGTTDDAKRLAELSRELPAIDVDDLRAHRIAALARQQVGRGPSPRRFVEPVLVGVFATSMLGWVVYKLIEILG